MRPYSSISGGVLLITSSAALWLANAATDAQLANDMPAVQSGEDSSKLTKRQAIGVGIGCGVGGLLLLLCMFYFLRRLCRRQPAPWARDLEKSLDLNKVMNVSSPATTTREKDLPTSRSRPVELTPAEEVELHAIQEGGRGSRSRPRGDSGLHVGLIASEAPAPQDAHASKTRSIMAWLDGADTPAMASRADGADGDSLARVPVLPAGLPLSAQVPSAAGPSGPRSPPGAVQRASNAVAAVAAALLKGPGKGSARHAAKAVEKGIVYAAFPPSAAGSPAPSTIDGSTRVRVSKAPHDAAQGQDVPDLINLGAPEEQAMHSSSGLQRWVSFTSTSSRAGIVFAPISLSRRSRTPEEAAAADGAAGTRAGPPALGRTSMTHERRSSRLSRTQVDSCMMSSAAAAVGGGAGQSWISFDDARSAGGAQPSQAAAPGGSAALLSAASSAAQGLAAPIGAAGTAAAAAALHPHMHGGYAPTLLPVLSEEPAADENLTPATTAATPGTSMAALSPSQQHSVGGFSTVVSPATMPTSPAGATRVAAPWAAVPPGAQAAASAPAAAAAAAAAGPAAAAVVLQPPLALSFQQGASALASPTSPDSLLVMPGGVIMALQQQQQYGTQSPSRGWQEPSSMASAAARTSGAAASPVKAMLQAGTAEASASWGANASQVRSGYNDLQQDMPTNLPAPPVQQQHGRKSPEPSELQAHASGGITFPKLATTMGSPDKLDKPAGNNDGPDDGAVAGIAAASQGRAGPSLAPLDAALAAAAANSEEGSAKSDVEPIAIATASATSQGSAGAFQLTPRPSTGVSPAPVTGRSTRITDHDPMSDSTSMSSFFTTSFVVPEEVVRRMATDSVGLSRTASAAGHDHQVFAQTLGEEAASSGEQQAVGMGEQSQTAARKVIEIIEALQPVCSIEAAIPDMK